VYAIVMPLLSRAKRKVGRAQGSAAMNADAKRAEFYTYPSGILLSIIVKDGIEGLQGKACAD
jgi:hypothetical protein